MGIRAGLSRLIVAIMIVASLVGCRATAAEQATARISYGPGASQFGELWLPQGSTAPVPVVVLVHGGCWQSSYGLDLMDPMAADLRRRGLAVWNIEYRRLGETGGGYPGTFIDLGQAFDALRMAAQRYTLNLSKVIAVGHSAGGQLALWAAARARLPQDSPLRSADAVHVSAVVTLAGINDLAAYRQSGPACDGASTISQLINAPPRPLDQALADTSPRALLPLGVPQLIASGSSDGIVPPHFGRDYALAARAAGDKVDALDLSGADHFGLIDPSSPAWRTLIPKILAFLK
jgi:acetyl esterase/lipase